MSLALAVPVFEAAVFTVGCAAIHALRRHSTAMTMALVGIAALLVLLIGIASTPEVYLTAQTYGVVAETSLIQPGD